MEREYKVIKLPTATKEDMIRSEAIHDAKNNYQMSGHDPEKYSKSFEKQVERRVKQVESVVNVNSFVLTGERTIKRLRPEKAGLDEDVKSYLLHDPYEDELKK